MKEINAKEITERLGALIKNALIDVEPATQKLISDAAKKESSYMCKWALEQISENNSVASATRSYACQDCGQAVIFAEVGQDLHIKGNLTQAINDGVALGYADARKSVADPLTRLNTKTNTPAVIHYDVTDGDKLTVTYLAKGAGSENMSKLFMLTPSKGENGIIDCVVQTVTDAGANPCPPIIIGVGIGGTMEKCAILSKKALTRETGKASGNPLCAKLEKKIYERVNATGIGAQGFGGDITALAVAVESAPTHIGMLPVAVNIQCHSVRHFSTVFIAK